MKENFYKVIKLISLKGMCYDIRLIAMAGDELWTTAITELTDNKRPYLRFIDTLTDATAIRMGKTPNTFDMFVPWEWIQQTMQLMGWDSCYIRRPAFK